MVSGGRGGRRAAIAGLLLAGGWALSGCGAATSTPANPTTPAPAPSASSTPATSAPSVSPTATPTVSGLTLRQLGFSNGPLDQFSLPSELQVSTRVDQPNVVTIVLAGPSPEVIEDYLRATLPTEGFAIDAQAADGQAMTFEGHGWSGGFTGTGPNSAVVLRPR